MTSPVFPGLGRLLRAWRIKQGCSTGQWALRLCRHGSRMWPQTMARVLAHAEATDEWRHDDPITSFGYFLRSSQAGLVHDSEDEKYFAQIVDLFYDTTPMYLGY